MTMGLFGAEPSPTCEFRVPGVAQPQGNKTAMPFQRRDGSLGANIVEGRRAKAREAFAEWRERLASRARAFAYTTRWTPLDGPVEAWLTFYLPRPRSVPKSQRFPIGKPDLDKLERAVGDALSRIIWTDDARIVRSHPAKLYADSVEPHAHIIVRPILEGAP